MPQEQFLPEGMTLETEHNRTYTETEAGLLRAAEQGIILEGRAVLCDAGHNLHVDINGMAGIIPRCEASIGIDTGKTKDIAIISRVGKPVCFVVLGCISGVWQLSRKAAQLRATDYFIEALHPGDVIPCRVTHIENFGAFVDIGCGVVSFIGVENISVSRISHPSERFCPKQSIYAAVLNVDKDERRITLSHRELLGTWAENAVKITAGETVGGIVRGVEDYGIFIELAPNLSGLAEKKEGVFVGMPVSVYIKSILPQRMKIKLVIIDGLECAGKKNISESDYFIKSGRLNAWHYSPPDCQGKLIETQFKA